MLAKAKQKDIGIVAMKMLMGAKLNDMRPYENGGATFVPERVSGGNHYYHHQVRVILPTPEWTIWRTNWFINRCFVLACFIGLLG